MAKTIGLKQLAQKVYTLVSGLPPELVDSIGEVEDAWDAILYGESGSGKTNCTVMIIKALLNAINCKAEYVSYEEGHGKTIQDLMIKRHNMLEIVGNRLAITEHLNYAELLKRMGRRQSPKIWIIDSLQASGLTYKEVKHLKETFVMSKKKKIIIFVSWSEGKVPQGAVAKSVEYYCNIKMRVQDLIMFPKSRYGGNKPFVIYEPLARARWGKAFNKVAQFSKTKSKTNDTANTPLPAAATGGSQPDSETNCETDKQKVA